MHKKINWPDNKDFAFTIFDDTDYARLDNVGEVYAFLKEHGFGTTKSVWPLKGDKTPVCGGSTCEDPEYLKWLLNLKESSFEIGYHLATYHSSVREETARGLEMFAKHFGHYPKSAANHTGCNECIYWGNYRLDGMYRIFYNLATRFRRFNRFRGHIENDQYFWGDLCKGRIKYFRNFAYPEINTLKACPFMPYHDPRRPYVNLWFASSEGSSVKLFNKCISEKNQDLLESEGGACIMYTHLASGFYRNNTLDSRFRELMTRLSGKNGWFVPVSTLLDYLCEKNGPHTITDKERRFLERKWLLHKLFTGTA